MITVTIKCAKCGAVAVAEYQHHGIDIPKNRFAKKGWRLRYSAKKQLMADICPDCFKAIHDKEKVDVTKKKTKKDD